MEEKTNEKESSGKKRWYDRRLLVEIVKQVEEGVPRHLINEKYGLGKSTLDIWMKAHGSENYHQNKRKTYSNLEKGKIVAAIEQGRMTVREACIAYQVC